MAINPLQHVQPGQLITAAWANEVVDEINAIIAELAATGSPPDNGPATSGPPVLTTRSPTGDVHVNDTITLLGQNFSPRHDGLTRVNFGGVQVSDSAFLPGTSDTQLRFAVPSVTPGTVTVRVITPQGTSANALSVHVLPAVLPQSGDVHIDSALDPSHPPTPTAGGTVQLQWSVDSDTIQPEAYAFALAFTDVTGPSWSGTLNATQMTVTPGSPFTVVATINVPTTGSANVALTATSTTDSSRNGSSNPIALAVNVVTAVSDPRIDIRVSNPQPDFDAHGNPSNAFLTFDGEQPVINVTRDSVSFVQMQVHFDDTVSVPPLHYRFFAEVDDLTHWSVQPASPPTLVQTTAGGTTTILYNLTNHATDAAQDQATLTVSAAKLQADGLTDDYVSFAPVTLRNAG
ncbi:MAG TPA: IPT/TIG domain-containing protein [Gaiellaceae bacterium]|nr:IPT/TIG domain-containing protein [Gaiellaceae bacterium]